MDADYSMASPNRKEDDRDDSKEETAKVDSGNVFFCRAVNMVFLQRHVAYFRCLKDHKNIS